MGQKVNKDLSISYYVMQVLILKYKAKIHESASAVD